MLLPKIFQRCVGIVRWRIIRDIFGYHVHFERLGSGFLFAAHRNPAFMELLKCNISDLQTYWAHAYFRQTPKSQEGELSRMTALAHSLEKGLANPKRKKTFGVLQVQELLPLINSQIQQPNGRNDPRIRWAIASLQEWVAHHEGNDSMSPELVSNCRILLTRETNSAPCEPTNTCMRVEIQAAAKGDFAALALSRHSVRDFSHEAVDMALVESAIALASRSPSACNRQSIRIICLHRGEKMKAALALQNGNRGFTEQIDKLLLVVSDIRCHLEHHERHQGYVDAGIFSMSLVHALHYQGLGTCYLNWAVDTGTDLALHSALDIPAYYSVACFIAVGNLPKCFKAAASHRLPLSSLIQIQK